MRVSFVVAGHPVGKGRPRTRVVATRAGRIFASHYTPAATRIHEAAIAQHAQLAMAGRAPFTGPVRLTVIQVHAVPASWSRKARDAALAGTIRPTVKPDWDNVGKAVSDAVNGVVYFDDKQVVSARVEKWYGPRPELEIVVETIENIPAAATAKQQQLSLGLANHE